LAPVLQTESHASDRNLAQREAEMGDDAAEHAVVAADQLHGENEDDQKQA